jgi:hypothetical protein
MAVSTTDTEGGAFWSGKASDALQGWHLADYLARADLYQSAGVDCSAGAEPWRSAVRSIDPPM